MNYKIILLIGIPWLLNTTIVAQSKVPRTPRISSGEGGFIKEVFLEKPSTKGTTYLDEAWRESEIYLNPDRSYDEYEVRYDVKNNMLELKKENKVKAIRSLRLHKVVIYQESGDSIILVNSSTVSKKFTNSLLEKLFEGKHASLYSRFYTELIPGNYLPEFDAGDKADKIILKEKHYLLIDNKLFEVPKTKKKLANLFGDKHKLIVNKIKKDQLRISQKEDLVKIIEFSDSIL